ncbi:sodium-dependent bicarbonate transport family permease [Synechococcus sp. CC9311]|uniref:sodium-dependent bicarbonate transport family permease n=1 Tax=Synechococcus sp. (strain CC9311) TaxID=64471 RepID=UPI0000DDB297|nr:sodium-dependent bicarbonate transport family permease [Synechococcus sp. CC9311]ABI45355.1 Predicted permease [Synechococcus sp. CC9311]
MNQALIFENIFSPAVLFFLLGALAVFLKINLEIPQPVSKLLSLYLLISIGFKGGVELIVSGLSGSVLKILLLCFVMAVIVPVYAFPILRQRFSSGDSAALAASFGSISAVTFITASSFLNELAVEHSGFMIAALALMESPAIVMGLILHEKSKQTPNNEQGKKKKFATIIQTSILNTSVFLLLGALVVGALSEFFDHSGVEKIAPFTNQIFYGVLCLFLLEMGISAASRINELRKSGIFLIAFSILFPLFNAFIAIALARFFSLEPGNALLFVILCASASYIAVPAAMRSSLPNANPSLYLSAALGVTFPFNIIIGIPLYFSLIQKFSS